MKSHHCAALLIAGIVVFGGIASAETPSINALVSMAIEAVESDSTMADHNMIRIGVHQEETLSDGTTETSDTTAIIHGGGLENTRFVLNQGVTLGLSGNTGWAVIGGKLDDRPQTPRMAAGTIRQTLFPLLLPFSLRMEGVTITAVNPATFDGTPAWRLDVNFEPNFFAAPAMLTTWRVFISRDDHLVLGADYPPVREFLAVVDEGIRYRYLKRQDVDGINLPAQVLLDGIDTNGIENGHVRVTKLDAETIGPFDLSLFISPEVAAKMEAEEF